MHDDHSALTFTDWIVGLSDGINVFGTLRKLSRNNLVYATQHVYFYFYLSPKHVNM